MLRIRIPYKKNKTALHSDLRHFFFHSVIIYLLKNRKKEVSHKMEFGYTLYVCMYLLGRYFYLLTYLGIELWLFILSDNRITK